MAPEALSAIDRAKRLLDEHPPAAMDATQFLLAQFDAGLAWLQDPEDRAAVSRLLEQAGAPNPFPATPIGVGMVGPTILQHGSDEQRARHLRRLWAGLDVWCQLFSEPGAGSDLSSLATRALRVEDGWVVDGQKVWTSRADQADFGLLLARTDVDAPKNRGI